MFDDGDRFDLVDILPAGSGSAASGPFQIAVSDLDAAACRFRKDRNGDGRGVNAAVALGGRNALPAVASAFAGEQGLGMPPLDPEHNQAGTLFEKVETKAPSAAQTCNRF
jgi:hypothetical protein